MCRMICDDNSMSDTGTDDPQHPEAGTHAVWEARLITLYSNSDRTKIGWIEPLSVSAQGKPYRIREPKGRHNYWKGKTLTLIKPDGTMAGTGIAILGSDDARVFFAFQAFTVEAGWSYRIDEMLPGATYERTASGWKLPAAAVGNALQATRIDPTAVTRYGKVRKHDLLTAELFGELRSSIDTLTATRVTGSWSSRTNEAVAEINHDTGDNINYDPGMPYMMKRPEAAWEAKYGFICSHFPNLTVDPWVENDTDPKGPYVSVALATEARTAAPAYEAQLHAFCYTEDLQNNETWVSATRTCGYPVDSNAGTKLSRAADYYVKAHHAVSSASTFSSEGSGSGISSASFYAGSAETNDAGLLNDAFIKWDTKPGNAATLKGKKFGNLKVPPSPNVPPLPETLPLEYLGTVSKPPPSMT